MSSKNIDLTKTKEWLKEFLSKDGQRKTVVFLGLAGIALIFMSGFFKSNHKKETVQTEAKVHTTDQYTEKLEQNLESIISGIQGAGQAKVLVTLESGKETVYATEEKKNKEASEDKADGSTTRKKESDDSEKKYITIKDSEGTEHALAVTEIEPKVKGVVVICSGGDNSLVRQRIIDAVTTALNVTSNRVCVTKSKSFE